MGGSSSSSKNTTEYKTQNISSPGAQQVSGGNMTINKVSKPALLLAGHSVDSAMAVSENAIKTVGGDIKDVSANALSKNLAVTNKALDTVGDTVELSYRQTTNQAQNIKAMTQNALEKVANASRPDSSVNNKLLIKTAGIVGGLALLASAVKKK